MEESSYFNGVNSFLNYEISVNKFPVEVQSFASLLKSAGDKASPSGLKMCLSLQSSLARGLQDEVSFLCGLSYEKDKKFDQALKSYELSLSLRSKNPLVNFRKAVVLKELNRCEEVLPTLAEIRWLTKDFEYESLYLQAGCYSALKQPDKALAALDASLKLNSSFLPSLKLQIQLLAQTNLIKSNPAQLRDALNKIVQQDPTDRDSSLLLCKLLLKKADPVLGGQELKEVERISGNFVNRSNYSDQEFLRILVESKLKRHDTNAALTLLDQGLMKDSKSALLLELKKQIEIEQTLNLTPAVPQ